MYLDFNQVHEVAADGAELVGHTTRCRGRASGTRPGPGWISEDRRCVKRHGVWPWADAVDHINIGQRPVDSVYDKFKQNLNGRMMVCNLHGRKNTATPKLTLVRQGNRDDEYIRPEKGSAFPFIWSFFTRTLRSTFFIFPLVSSCCFLTVPYAPLLGRWCTARKERPLLFRMSVVAMLCRNIDHNPPNSTTAVSSE